MKKVTAFNLHLIIISLVLLLFSQPTSIVYCAQRESRQYWELISDVAFQEGEFTKEPQELVLVYRKKISILPSQRALLKMSPMFIPPSNKQVTQYGELLHNLSGVFLFGSRHSY
ncbi:hypothetical protein GIX45_25370 [Erwinia sp. CPCC 100877]|nr:hypothetical protein [Erwinia sp. CPCC 100877]